MKKQKENSHEGITWSEMGKQNVQAEKVYSTSHPTYNVNNISVFGKKNIVYTDTENRQVNEYNPEKNML